MKIFILVIAAVLLSGCAAMDMFKEKAAELNDEGLISAEFTICKAASIGSIMRRYGLSEEKAKAWKVLCTSDGNAASTILDN